MNPRTAAPLGLAALLVTTIGSSAARADTTYQTTTAIVAASVFAAADVVFASYALTMSERGRAPARAMVITELTVMTLQIATGISMIATALQPDDRLVRLGIERDLYLPVGAVLVTIAAPLFAHAVRHGVDRVGSGMHASAVGLRRLPLVLPARIGDARSGGPGIVLAGSF